VSRSGAPVKKAFRMVVEMMHKVFGAALPGPDASERALALVSLCVGAMVVARAVDDPPCPTRSAWPPASTCSPAPGGRDPAASAARISYSGFQSIAVSLCVCTWLRRHPRA
jgi:hypothetical protein